MYCKWQLRVCTCLLQCLSHMRRIWMAFEHSMWLQYWQWYKWLFGNTWGYSRIRYRGGRASTHLFLPTDIADDGVGSRAGGWTQDCHHPLRHDLAHYQEAGERPELLMSALKQVCLSERNAIHHLKQKSSLVTYCKYHPITSPNAY